MSLESQLEREEDALQRDLDEGHISQEEFRKAMRELQREFRDAVRDAYRNEYGQEDW